ncbi:hypothetical protein [Rhodopseudomonas sp.]|uniref:hypothetical protein n=1 Tax=Rhodopseudomonas sp. TaxID=1078 RepID=UPI003B3AC7A4
MSDLTVHQGPRRVSREELFKLVWQKPLIRLAEEFGISGNGLAKICDRMDVPYPPRGYWAKKEAGKPVVAFRLPPRKDGILQTTDIYPTPPKPVRPPEAERSAAVATAKVEALAIPKDLETLHPRVKAWIAEHRKEQKEREQESRRRRHETWWTSRLLSDLTARDLYRFCVTSAIFTGVEKAGGRIEKSPVTGRVTFLIATHAVECSIVEKLVKSLKQRDETRKWTAYPDHHQSGLDSSGFLRVSITTYLNGHQRQWIESQKIKMDGLLPEIVGAIMAAGPILEEQKREREEREKRYREEEARRYEARRLREIDDKRWNKFRGFAADWENHDKLLLFLAEVERRALEEGNACVGDIALSDWIAWARERAESLDPLRQGAAEMFSAISRVSQWS